MTDLVDHIRIDAQALVTAAESNPGAAIDRYDGWTQLDLLVHTGSVHRRTLEVVRSRSLERMGRSFPPDEEWDTVVPWFREGAEAMVEVLEHTDPRTPVWAFGPVPCVGSWRVRMALETTVHRWDAEEAVGSPRPIDPVLAARGIDEFGILWAGTVPSDGLDHDLCLRATDVARAWVFGVFEGAVRLGSGEAGDSIAGSASDLYLWLLGRGNADSLTVAGDVDAWERSIRSLPDASR